MDQENNKKVLEEIAVALANLNNKIEKQNERIKSLENKIFMIRPKQENGVFSISATHPPKPPSPPKEEKIITEKAKENIEERIGGKWFAKIGIAVLIIGISLFLKYAFDNNWIGETGRVILGILAGTVLLAMGEKFIRKYFIYGQILAGGGIAVLYLSIFSAFNFYHLISSYAAFAIMALITAISIALSLRYDALSLMGVAILGGFATPILCSTGENNQVGLFSYILLLDLAILAVSIFKKWRELNIIGFIGTVILFFAWYAKFYTIKQLFSTVFFLSLFFLVYSISSVIYNLYKGEKSTGTEQILTLVAGVAYFSSSYGLLNKNYHIWMGFFALIMAVYYFLWAYLVREITPDDEKLYNFLAFLTVGFITIAIPIQFKQYIVTIGWIIEALLLFYLGVKVEKDNEYNQIASLLFGSVIGIIAILRLLFFDAQRFIPNEIFIFNKRFFTFLFAILAFYLAGYIFKKGAQSLENQSRISQLKKFMAASLIIANFFTLFALSQEIVEYHNREIRGEEHKIMDERSGHRGDYFAFERDKNYEVIAVKIRNLNYRKSILLSIFWLIYGVILLIIGFIRRHKEIRLGGIILVVLSILKLFLYDLWSLGTLYRIISSITLGVVLLLISFAYQKYKDKIKEII